MVISKEGRIVKDSALALFYRHVLLRCAGNNMNLRYIIHYFCKDGSLMGQEKRIMNC